jgi:hypothetical protein
VNVSELTNSSVYSIDYSNASRNLRNNKYVTKTLTLVGKRDMYIDQLTIPPPFYLTDDQGDFLLDYNNLNLTE